MAKKESMTEKYAKRAKFKTASGPAAKRKAAMDAAEAKAVGKKPAKKK